MGKRNQLFQVFWKIEVFAKEILLFIKISKAEIKITSIPNQRAIDERKERVNQFVKLMDLVRGTNYNNKYSFDFQVY